MTKTKSTTNALPCPSLPLCPHTHRLTLPRSKPRNGAPPATPQSLGRGAKSDTPLASLAGKGERATWAALEPLISAAEEALPSGAGARRFAS